MFHAVLQSLNRDLNMGSRLFPGLAFPVRTAGGERDAGGPASHVFVGRPSFPLVGAILAIFFIM